jgi:4-hydroxybenzoate polyprenyltransferase
MKIEGWTFILGFLFYSVVGGAYWWFSRDEVGTTLLILTGALAFLVAFYTLYTAKRVYPRPEDRQDGEIDEADPEYGFFSPQSWWPLVVGLGASGIILGLVFAVWFVVLSVAILMLGIIGWLFEYYRGEFAR